MSEELYKRYRPSSFKEVVGQIHDSMLCDVHRSELDDVAAKVRELATEQLPKTWRWIVVPLAVDVEVAEENWFEKAGMV